ncbi:MAG: DNA-deoxyinosine glycosylase [Gammaproteobacteria bacterium]|jgi:TDG/mug DNA glycosylase family protein
MSENTGFPPIAKLDAKILILGSMPGVKSFEKNQYYANPRNTFWSIMIKLLNGDEELNYQQRKKLLTNNRIALWDVLKSCYREGSLDSNIDHSTIIANDFNLFLNKQKQIKTILFNGGETEKLFNKYVMKTLDNKEIEYFKLPSTSPAHAAMSFDEKLLKWQVIKELL